MKTGIWIIIIVVVLLASGGIYFLTQSGYKAPATNQNSNPPQNTNPPANPSSGTPQTKTIEISGFAFNPATLTIKKGDSVVWTNQDSAAHTIKSDTGNEISSSSLSKGETYNHKFDLTGTYAYHCGIHPSMKATIIVE